MRSDGGAVVRLAGIRAGADPCGARRNATCGVSALPDGDVVARALARVDLPRPGDLLLLVLDPLQPLRDPAARARDREQDGEHAAGHAERPVAQPGAEVDVRVELPLDEVLV